MKMLYVTDLHGAVWKYEQLFDAASAFGAELIIDGGDMLPKTGDLHRQGEFITGYLAGHFSRFDAAGISYLSYLGNDDLRIFDALFEQTCRQYPNVHNLAQRKVAIGGYEFVGMNWVVDYPFRLKDRCRKDTSSYVFQPQIGMGLLSTSEGWQEIPDWFSFAATLPTIAEEMNLLVRPADMTRAIYILHMPPARLGLDKCGHGAEVGSQAIYDFLLTHQPRLSLHGHIHESPETSGRWYAQLGNTMCIQPGQLDPFTYVTIDLDTLQCERVTHPQE